MSKRTSKTCCDNSPRSFVRAVCLALIAVALILAYGKAAFADTPAAPAVPPIPCQQLIPCSQTMTLTHTIQSVGEPIPGSMGMGPLGSTSGNFNNQLDDVKTTSQDLKDALTSGDQVPKGDHQRGTASFNTAFKNGTDKAKQSFSQCQATEKDKHDHDLSKLAEWWYPPIQAMITRITGWGGVMPPCVSHWGYDGPTIGSCWVLHPDECDPPWHMPICPCLYGYPGDWDVYDLIEYNYPTGRVNVSEQPFQSALIQPSDYQAGQNYMNSQGYQTIADNMHSGIDAINSAVHSGMVAMQATPPSAVGQWGTAQDNIVSSSGTQSVANLMKNLPSKLPAGAEDPRLRNSANHYMEARYFSEDEVGIANGTLGFSFIPHVPKYGNKVLTDPGGDAWATAVILGQSQQIDTSRWGPYLQPPSGVRGAKCVENNKMNAGYAINLDIGIKTPADMLSKIQGSNDHDLRDLANSLLPPPMSALFSPLEMTGPSNVCLDNVGEIFPYTHYSRINPTDQVLAAAMKIAQWTDVQDPWISRGPAPFIPPPANVIMSMAVPFHTFQHEWDRWKLLDDAGFYEGSLTAEIGDQCKPMGADGGINSHHIAKRNVDFSASVMKKTMMATEATFEINTLFKGCYVPALCISGSNICIPLGADGHGHGETAANWGVLSDDCSGVDSTCWEDNGPEFINYGTMRTH